MPTYSLTLRSQKQGKITIEELDNNFLYLQDLASQSGGGSVDIDPGQIAFGSPSGLTSSPYFIINPISEDPIFGTFFGGGNLILGAQGPQGNSISGTTSVSLVMGGLSNQIIDNDSIGKYNLPSSSSIIGGIYNRIENQSIFSTILGGFENKIYYNSPISSIIGGYFNTIYCSGNSSIISGSNNCMCYTSLNSIIAGRENCIQNYSYYSTIIGTRDSCIDSSEYSSILAGGINTICDSNCSVILGGNNLTLNNKCNTVLVPNFFIAGSMSPNCGNNFGWSGCISIPGSMNTINVCNGVIIGFGFI